MLALSFFPVPRILYEDIVIFSLTNMTKASLFEKQVDDAEM